MLAAAPRPRRRWGRREEGDLGSRLDAHDLYVDVPWPRPVELGEEDGLEAPEGELAAADPHGHAAAEQRRPQVGMRIAPLAVRIARIVVTVAVVLGHQRLDHRLDVLDEGTLEFI